MNEIGPVEIGGIVLLLLFIAWMVLFFQVVRPRLMEWVGARFNVRVRESTDALDAGTYSVVGDAPLAKHGVVVLIDFVVLLLGTVGVCALISIPAFLIGDSGLPYRVEGMLLGQGARISGAQFPPLRGDKSIGTVVVVNEANNTVVGCQVDVADYQVSNGYLTGATSFFDLAPRETRTEALTLSAMSAKPGTYEIRLSLECGNRVKEKVRTQITVE